MKIWCVDNIDETGEYMWLFHEGCFEKLCNSHNSRLYYLTNEDEFTWTKTMAEHGEACKLCGKRFLSWD